MTTTLAIIATAALGLALTLWQYARASRAVVEKKAAQAQALEAERALMVSQADCAREQARVLAESERAKEALERHTALILYLQDAARESTTEAKIERFEAALGRLRGPR